MSQPEVTIEQGKLRGLVATNFDGENYFRFQGIPYAKPPIGELRFKDPLPPERWNGTFEATKEGDPCISRNFRYRTVSGSENCLTLNVYTKGLDNNLRPVLFWIHGGGFSAGSSSTEMYGPEYLLIEDVVVVSINYRLGMLGFLSLEDPSLGIPGNAAFKDMVMALKWVQKNIQKFGGDPNNVTIFGESAGGAAVHILCLSEMSKGLFHKAIAQSGSALNPWIRGKKGVKDIATAIGQDGADEKTIYKYLMEKSAEEIYEIQETITEYDFFPYNIRPFCLVVENQVNEAAFFTDEPINIIRSGRFHQVPFMAGYNSKEGMLVEMLKNPKHPERPNFEDTVPWFFGYQFGSPEHNAAAEKIKNFYYGSEEPSLKNIGTRYDIISDTLFINGIYVSILKQCKFSKAPIYLYRMSIESGLNLFKQILKITEPGVSHADDIFYLFKTMFTPEVKPGSLEDTAIRRFVRLWTNFAKYGNPTPKSDDLLNVIWKPIEGTEIDLLDIGENLVVSTSPEAERMNFWEKLYANSPAGKKSKN